MEDKVTGLIYKAEKWSECLIALRELLAETALVETIKWGGPVYTINNKNVIGLGAFKAYCGIWFFQGVFLSDPAQVLHNAGEGKTKGLRQWRFHSLQEVKDSERLIRIYLSEAINNQLDGKEMKTAKPVKKVNLPEILSEVMKKDKHLDDAFHSLTPGRQKEYIEHIVTAKQEKTRISRLEKCIPMIKTGVGLNDKYKKC